MSSKKFLGWCGDKIMVEWIQLGMPSQNAYIESLNGKRRDEFLNETLFDNVEDAQAKATEWRRYDNGEKLRQSRGYMTPNEFGQEFRSTT